MRAGCRRPTEIVLADQEYLVADLMGKNGMSCCDNEHVYVLERGYTLKGEADDAFTINKVHRQTGCKDPVATVEKEPNAEGGSEADVIDPKAGLLRASGVVNTVSCARSRPKLSSTMP